MTDRPKVLLDGHQYERDRGDWVDVSTRLRVPSTLAHRLDAVAKSDRELWKMCRQQDRSDDPKKGSGLWLDILEMLGVRELPTGGATPGKKVKRRTTDLKWQFVRNGEALKLSADIKSEWRETARSWCFRSAARIELPRGLSLRVTISLVEDTWNYQRRCPAVTSGLERSVKHEDIASTYPRFDHRIVRLDENAAVLLEQDACVCVVFLFEAGQELNRALPWQKVDGRRRLQFAESGLYERPLGVVGKPTTASRPFRFELDAVVRDARRDRLGPQYERDTPFPSAGLPTLGKRR